MLCDKCGQRDATIHLLDIHRGIYAETHLCEQCAEMFLPLERSDMADFLDRLPPLQSPPHDIYSEAEPEPFPGETEITSVAMHVLVADPRLSTVVSVTPAEGKSLKPVWSPCSTMLAHVFLDHTRYAIRVTDPTARHYQTFYDVSWGEPPQWTPDGSCLFFSRPVGDVRAPVLADVRTGHLSSVLDRPDRDQHNPVVSPDGRRFVYLSGPPSVNLGESPEVSLMSDTLPVSSSLPLMTERDLEFIPLSWSPDSRFFATLVCERVPDDQDFMDIEVEPSELLIFEPRTGKIVLRQSCVAACAWSGDASRLLVVRDHEGSMSLECLTTGEWSAPPVPVAESVYLPAGTLGTSVWSSDGRSVSFIAGREGHRRAWVASPGETPRPVAAEDCKAAAWNPLGPELALLCKTRRAHEVRLVDPRSDVPARTVITIDARDYHDVVGLTWSTDGRLLAIEAHSARVQDESV